MRARRGTVAHAVRPVRRDGVRLRLRGVRPPRPPRAPGAAGTRSSSAYGQTVPGVGARWRGPEGEGRRSRRPVRSRVHVDHDRRTGKVRDVLCLSCNAALGQFKDRPDALGRPNIRKETCGSQHS
ncbi:endonuclease domain-containing protein [Streptomyces sp. NPDC018045]|uniref:endonuclease domain-containing protein n=1 Tax=Streptomyces sp. NPDC018045 TaxID=3365037 RepID=UPI0037A93EAF